MAKKKRTVVLIEDDRYYRLAYQDGLKEAGFDVFLAGNGKEGLKLVQSEKPDLILLDLIMPIKNGFETLEELKMDDKLKEIPVIILSNLGQDSDIEKAKALGSTDYLIKSNFSMKEVIEKIKFHLIAKKH